MFGLELMKQDIQYGMKLVNVNVDQVQVFVIINNNKCRCECKELIDKGICDEGFIQNLKNCECECDKSCDVENIYEKIVNVERNQSISQLKNLFIFIGN